MEINTTPVLLLLRFQALFVIATYEKDILPPWHRKRNAILQQRKDSNNCIESFPLHQKPDKATSASRNKNLATRSREETQASDARAIYKAKSQMNGLSSSMRVGDMELQKLDWSFFVIDLLSRLSCWELLCFAVFVKRRQFLRTLMLSISPMASLARHELEGLLIYIFEDPWCCPQGT